MWIDHGTQALKKKKCRIKSRKFQVKRRGLVLQQPAAEGWLVPSDVLQDTSENKEKTINQNLDKYVTTETSETVILKQII